MNDRAAFEAAISGPPYERDIARWPDDPKGYGWPGSYKDINVARAWQMWQEAARQEREACAAVCDEWRRGCDNRTMQAEGWAADECASAIRSRSEK